MEEYIFKKISFLITIRIHFGICWDRGAKLGKGYREKTKFYKEDALCLYTPQEKARKSLLSHFRHVVQPILPPVGK